MISALGAALTGAGGSVVGGIVGGGFAILAARSQWKRDRAAARADRSHNAARSIGESLASMEEALVAWSAGQSNLPALRAAFNSFSRMAAVQSMVLSDGPLRQRVRRHVELLSIIATLAETQPANSAALVPTARLHASAVLEALDAHCNDAALPSYQPLPLTDAAALIGWQPVPAPKRDKDAGGFGH